MKLILTCIVACLAGFNLLLAQDTIYVDNQAMPVTSKTMAVNYYVLHHDSTDPNKVMEQVCTLSGIKLRETHYSDYQQKVLHGSVKYWYPTGVLQTEENYSHGRLDGALKTFWPSGQPRRSDVYTNGELAPGTVWDTTGNELKY